MKKIFTLAAAITMMANVSAQDITMSEPKFANEFGTEAVMPLGISANGNILWGTDPIGTVAFYDFDNTESPLQWISYEGNTDFGLKVAGITSDNKIIVSSYTNSFFYDINDHSIIDIESPDEDFGLDVWAVTPDGKYLGCNLANDEFDVIPMIGIMQDDGTYKIDYLDYDPKDAMGCNSQYTQVRHISDDGKYIMGIQPDDRGMAGRIVVWTRQDDGTYEFSTPLDDFLYDFTCEKPGAAPEFDDYVTADYETERDLFDKQYEEYNKIWDAYEHNYTKFTKGSNLEMYNTLKTTRDSKMMLTYYDYTNGRDGQATPLFYDCETGNIKFYPCDYEGTAAETLPGGGEIIDNGSDLMAIDNEGNETPFFEWLENLTGKNESELFTWTGSLPMFSADGKSLMMYGGNTENEASATVFTFDRDIFAAVSTGIKVNITNEISMNGGKIMVGEGNGKAEVFALNGAKCGEFSVNGTLDLNNRLAAGTYIVKVTADGAKPAAMKMVIK